MPFPCLMAGVRKNFAYNLLLTLSNYVFPLITYPYVSRMLGVENIGICNFVDGIVNYFVLFSQLGIGIYGVREIARCKEDPVRLQEVFSNLFFLNLVISGVAALVLIVCTYTVPAFAPYRSFLLVGLFKLMFTLFLVDWFFQGIEQFRYITIRSIGVRILYVIGVFALVRDAGDALVYYALTTGTIVLNALLNWHYSKRFCRISFRHLNLSPFLAPVLIFGLYKILTSMYTTFNVVYLGFVRDNVQVGFFSQASKLYSLIMAVFSAFTAVMIPRMSSLLHEGRKEEVQGVVDRIVHLLAALSVPVIILCVSNAPAIVRLVSGPGFEGAEVPFRIVIGLLLVIGLEQIVIQQCLMASKDTRPTLYVSVVGAVIGVILNLLLVPKWGAVGSSVCWAVSELCVLFAGLYFLRRELGLMLHPAELLRPMVFGLAYVLPALLAVLLVHDMWWRLAVTIVLMIPVFLLVNLRWDPNSLVDEMKLALQKFRR